MAVLITKNFTNIYFETSKKGCQAKMACLVA